METKAASAYANYSYEQCARSFDGMFGVAGLGGGEWLARLNTAEKMASNDCYLKYRYTHEFVTNYDFDEFIFPRHLPLDDYSPYLNKSCDQVQAEATTSNHNMYEYARQLVAKYQNNTSSSSSSSSSDSNSGEKVAALLFPHYYALPTNRSSDQVQLRTYHNERSVTFLLNHKKVFLFLGRRRSRRNATARIIDRMQRAFNLSVCLLRQGPSLSTRFDTSWTSPFLLHVSNRLGKSIYVSEHTEIINQHDTYAVMPGTQLVNVKARDGINSHYRDFGLDNYLLKVNSSLSLSFEIEFYSLLMHLAKSQL